MEYFIKYPAKILVQMNTGMKLSTIQYRYNPPHDPAFQHYHLNITTHHSPQLSKNPLSNMTSYGPFIAQKPTGSTILPALPLPLKNTARTHIIRTNRHTKSKAHTILFPPH